MWNRKTNYSRITTMNSLENLTYAQVKILRFHESGVLDVGDFGPKLLQLKERADKLCRQNLHMKVVLVRFDTDDICLKLE